MEWLASSKGGGESLKRDKNQTKKREVHRNILQTSKTNVFMEIIAVNIL
jgi:hypothetical protein